MKIYLEDFNAVEELYKQLFGGDNILKQGEPGQDTREENPAGKDGGGEGKG